MTVRQPDTITIGNVYVDLKREVIRDAEGTILSLRPQSFEVLRYLAENPERLVTKDELASAIWQGAAASDDSLVQCVSDIRRLLGNDAHQIVKTVPRRGYRLTLASDQAAKMRTGHRGLLALAACVVVTAAALFVWLASGISKAPQSLPVVAVFPFEARYTDALSQRLADGLTDEILLELDRMPEFEVRLLGADKSVESHLSDVRFADGNLGAQYILRGAVRRENEAVRISASLIDVTSGNQRWSDLWDRSVGDTFNTQSEIAAVVANRLGGGEGVIQQLGRAMARGKAKESLNAYELYLVATEKLVRMSPDAVAEAYDLLQLAIERDPNFARAWIELYHTAEILAQIGEPEDAPKLREEARHAADLAVELDPSDAEAHAVLAIALTKDGETERAIKAFDTALNLAPNAFEILTFFAAYAATLGEAERGADMAERAIRLNPDYPFWATGPFAYAFFEARRPNDALRQIQRRPTTSMKPGLWVIKADSLQALGKRNEAKEAVQQALRHYPALSVEWILDLEPGLAGPSSRLVEAMQEVEFPICAPERQRGRLRSPARLPECSADRGGELTSIRALPGN